MNTTEMMIAVSSFRDDVPKDKPLEQRINWAMNHVRENQRDIFWMSHSISDGAMFQTALAAVMFSASEEEKSLITKSVMPLRALDAAMSGIPVDFGDVDTEGILPLMKMWRQAAASDTAKKDS
jgi:hypothetical protein